MTPACAFPVLAPYADPFTGSQVLIAASACQGSALATCQGLHLWRVPAPTGAASIMPTPLDPVPAALQRTGFTGFARGDTLLLFGGYDSAGRLTNTLLGVAPNGSGTLLPTRDPPPPRAFAAMAYDPETRRAYLFGGVGSDGLLFDTWVLEIE